MSDYSQFLYQGQEGKHDRWRFILMVAIMIVGGLVVKYLLETLFLSSMDSDDPFAQVLRSQVIQHVVAAALLFILLKPIHGRSPASLFTSHSSFRWRHLLASLGVAFVLMFILSPSLTYIVHGQGIIWQWEKEGGLLPMLLSFIYVPINVASLYIIFFGYFFQEISVRKRVPLKAARLTFLWYFLLLNSFVITWLFEDWGFPWKWVINGGMVVSFLLILLVVLDDGLEMVIGFRIGTAFFEILVDIREMEEKIFNTEENNIFQNDFFFDGYIRFFTIDWGAILFLFLFYVIIQRRIKLHPRSILRKPIPAWQPEAFDLIDEIGKDRSS